MEIDTCTWKKTSYGYKSGCGYQTKNSIMNFVYCPYCGLKFGYNQQKYMQDYYKKRKPKYAEYYKGYYKEHKNG